MLQEQKQEQFNKILNQITKGQQIAEVFWFIDEVLKRNDVKNIDDLCNLLNDKNRFVEFFTTSFYYCKDIKQYADFSYNYLSSFKVVASSKKSPKALNKIIKKSR